MSASSQDILRRRRSSLSSRGNSPTRSVSSRNSSRDEAEEFKHEVEHVRERNWNAPRPKWDINSPHHHRPESPSIHASHSHSRLRADSLHTSTKKGASPSHSTLTPSQPGLRPSSSHSNLKNGHPPRPLSPLPPLSAGKNTPNLSRASSHPSRLPTPSTTPHHKVQESPAKTPASGREGWSFPRNRASLPPLERDPDSPERSPLLPVNGATHARQLSSPTPSSKSPKFISNSLGTSHIPIPVTPHRPQNLTVASPYTGPIPGSPEGSPRRGHRRAKAELAEAVGRIRPGINDEYRAPIDIEPIPLVKVPSGGEFSMMLWCFYVVEIHTSCPRVRENTHT